MRKPIKILSVIGTRPEAIKMAALLEKLANDEQRFRSVVCATGQHRELFDKIVGPLQVRVDYDLDLMRDNQRLAELTARILESVDRVLSQVRPDLVLVQGDTTTAFVAALAAFYDKIPVAHIEAGLRTGDLASPFPEEGNRALIDRVAAFCFAPTERSRKNLLAEAIDPERIFVTGNTGIDTLLMVRERLRRIGPASWNGVWGSAQAVLERGEGPIILVTVHRRESFGAPMAAIFDAVRELAHAHPNWAFIYPVHLNPHVSQAAGQALSSVPNVHLLAPLEYQPFVYLMDRCHVILTDSGGIQEEAPSLGKPVLVVRDRTERQEAIESGTAVLVGTGKERIKEAVESLCGSDDLYTRLVDRPNPFGDGLASDRIVEILARAFA